MKLTESQKAKIRKEEAKEYGYKIHELDELKTLFEKSCPLKFIYNWGLTEYYVGQFEDAKFIQ
jgi:hypothetical protein